MFITRVTKSVIKTNKQSRKKRRGWYTKEAMAKDLGWSSLLIFTLYISVSLADYLCLILISRFFTLPNFFWGLDSIWMSQPITIIKVSTMQRKPPLLHTLKTPCSGCGPRVNFVSLPGPTSSAWWSFVRSRRMLQRSQRNFFAHGGLHGHGNLYQSLSILQLQDVLFKLVQAIQK